jgi:AcrR family transcriptional regulator
MAEPVDTATAILASAATMLREQTFDDISYRALGDAVGVSERTVYRQYPTRSHLLAALATWVEQTHFAVPPFVTIEEFRTAMRARFRSFDEAPAFAFVCARAATISPTDDVESSYLTRAIEALLETRAPTLNARDLQRVASTLRYFSSAQFWARCRAGFDMDAEEIGDIFDRTLRLAMGGRPSQTWVTA